MGKVFISHNNIISSLGFTSEAVVKNIHNEQSGLALVNNKTVLPNPFYSSLIDTSILIHQFSEIGNTENYTRLEQMMILSLHNVLSKTKLELNNRVGLIIATTKGNIDALDANNTFPNSRAYLSELGKQIQQFFNFKNEAIVVSNACVSGVLAVAIAKRYINQGVYDDVLIVSGDVITSFILSGFNSFQALSEKPCRPYSKNRAGINIGELAASVLVTSNDTALVKESVEILGEASCNDANHISGPSRTGEGLYQSIQSALKQSGLQASDVDYISAHGTATMYNDEMEAIAFDRAGMVSVPVNSLKGYFGHTLGASGLLETIIGMHSLANNTLYASLGFDELGVSKPINVIQKTTSKKIKTFLKTASGFGGCNTAVIYKKYKN